MSKNKPTPEEDVEFMKGYIDRVRWKFAKTYAKSAPHEYTIREWDEEREEEFIRFVKIIRTYGYPERFWKKINFYYEVDGMKYWTMGYPVREITKVINRADVNQFYGSQHPIEEFEREAPF